MKITFNAKQHLALFQALLRGTPYLPPLKGKAVELLKLKEFVESAMAAALGGKPEAKFEELSEAIELEVKGATIDAIQSLLQKALDSGEMAAPQLIAYLDAAKSIGASLKIENEEPKDAE